MRMKLNDLLKLCYDSRKLTIRAYLGGQAPADSCGPYYIDVANNDYYNDWYVEWWDITDNNIFEIKLEKLVEATPPSVDD